MLIESFEDLGLILGIFLMLLIALGQLFLKDKDQKNYLFIAMCVSISLFQFSRVYHVFCGNPFLFSLFPGVYTLGMFFIYCGVPISFLLLTSLLQKEFRFSFKHFFHFVPAVLVLFILFIFGDFPNNPGVIPLDYISNIYRNNTIIRYIDIASIFQFFVYFFILLRIILKRYNNTRGNSRKNIFLILSLSVLAIILCAFYLFSHKEVFFFGTLYRLRFSIMAVFIFLTSYANPFLLNIKKLEPYRDSYEKSYIGTINTRQIILKLEKLMDEEMIFTQENLTIENVAGHLSITRHQLSEIFNLHLNISFTSYIRRKRLEYAKKLLKENTNHKIIEIAFESGYGSISNFNSSFKKEFGLTPREYREKAAKTKL